MRNLDIVLRLLVSFLFLVFCGALDPDSKGVCVVKTSSQKTRIKYYTAFTNRYCGKKKCVVKKTKRENYAVTANKTVCCIGYEYNSSDDACVPHCSTGCLGGVCVAPDVCECPSPARPDPAHPNQCLPPPPSCKTPCVNAECVEGKCSCLTGFTIFNETHCDPKCDEDCLNGVCLAPNTCTCNEGYKSIDRFSCEPTCETPCENSTCVSFNNCSCLDGYRKISDHQCSPICEACENGDCVAPNTCECKLGFSKNYGVCKPVCEEECVNAVCTGPNECSCMDGFVRNGTHECQDPCAVCNGTCLDGVCLALVESCRTPVLKNISVQKSRLVPKYRTYRCGRGKLCKKPVTVNETYPALEKVPACCKNWEYKPTTDNCHPICELGCVNGTCVDPNVCHCEPPLILLNHACVQPTCDSPCFNAQCTANNVCTCNEDFSFFNSTHCAPICESGFRLEDFECKPVCHGCTVGTCIAPDTCQCPVGYKLVDEDCEPVCDPECENSDCEAPNVCRCHEGYDRESAWSCSPKCASCDNGDCVAPDTCECKHGYSKNDGICSPVCERNCTNGLCTAPDTCSCTPRYQIKADKFTCEPICDSDCVNSTCINPNTCSCWSGYHMTNEPNICAPTCDRCENGSCVAPDTCICLPGYALIDGKCIPQCERNCTNGFCSAPKTCTCHLGYEVDVNDSYACYPVCDLPCINGNCEFPNVCSCFPGYKVHEDRWGCNPVCSACDNGVCVAPDTCECLDEGYRAVDGGCAPVCLDPCVNGECTSPNECECEKDYIKNETAPHICFKPCIDCFMGSCSIDGLCICNSGYALVNETCVSIDPVECTSCNGTCTLTACACAKGTPCYVLPDTEKTEAASLTLAGMQITWLAAGIVTLLLLVIIIVIIQRTWRRHKVSKSVDLGVPFDSVMYPAENTLMRRRSIEEHNVDELDDNHDHEKNNDFNRENVCLKLLKTGVEEVDEEDGH